MAYNFTFVKCSYPFFCICSLLYLWLIISFISYREKRPRDEENEDFEAMAFEGFEAIREEEETVIAPVVPLKIIPPTASGTTPSAPPRPQPQVKKTKMIIPTRETRSKSVKPASNTRSKSKI